MGGGGDHTPRPHPLISSLVYQFMSNRMISRFLTSCLVVFTPSREYLGKGTLAQRARTALQRHQQQVTFYREKVHFEMTWSIVCASTCYCMTCIVRWWCKDRPMGGCIHQHTVWARPIKTRFAGGFIPRLSGCRIISIHSRYINP